MFGIFEFFSLLFPKKQKEAPIIKIGGNLQPASPEAPREVEKTNNGTPMVIVPTDSLATFENFVNAEDNKMYVFKYILNELTKAVKYNWDAVELFRIGRTKTVAKIDKQNYEKTLVDLRTYFTQREEYEIAERCNKLIKRHNVNILTK
jgi:hypothetical protein